MEGHPRVLQKKKEREKPNEIKNRVWHIQTYTHNARDEAMDR